MAYDKTILKKGLRPQLAFPCARNNEGTHQKTPPRLLMINPHLYTPHRKINHADLTLMLLDTGHAIL